MSNNTVLCICYKCKKKGPDGDYVHPTTRWRHIKKVKKNQKLINDDDGDDDAADDDDDNDDDDDDDNFNGNDNDDDNDTADDDDDDDDDDVEHRLVLRIFLYLLVNGNIRY